MIWEKNHGLQAMRPCLCFLGYLHFWKLPLFDTELQRFLCSSAWHKWQQYRPSMALVARGLLSWDLKDTNLVCGCLITNIFTSISNNISPWIIGLTHATGQPVSVKLLDFADWKQKHQPGGTQNAGSGALDCGSLFSEETTAGPHRFGTPSIFTSIVMAIKFSLSPRDWGEFRRGLSTWIFQYPTLVLAGPHFPLSLHHALCK